SESANTSTRDWRGSFPQRARVSGPVLAAVPSRTLRLLRLPDCPWRCHRRAVTSGKPELWSLPEILGAGTDVSAVDLVVDLQADAGFVGEDNVAILDHRLVLQGEVVPTGVVDPVPLHDQEVGDGGADVGGGHRAERTADVVRGERDVVDLGHVGDFAAF